MSGLQFLDVELRQRGDQFFRGVEHIFAAADREACGLSCAGVVDDDAGGLVQFGAVIEGIGAGTDQSLLFAGKKNEADGARAVSRLTP